jgi:tRNA(Arg) A34 adenosine deaminase TadA
MDKVIKMFNLARYAASKQGKLERRDFWHGAVGERSDGTIVSSRNSHAVERFRHAHAETKLTKKLNVGSTVYVVRVGRTDGFLRLSKPCANCMIAMRIRGIKKCYYSISEHEYGCITF